MRQVVRLLSFVPQASRLLLIVILYQVLAGLCAILQAFLVSELVGRAFSTELPLDTLRGIGVLAALTIGVRAISLWQGGKAAAALAACVKDTIRLRLFERLLALGPLFTRRRQTGELTTLLMEGVENLDPFFVQYLPQVVVAAVVPVSILVVVFSHDWISGLIFLLTAPLLPLFMALIGKAGEALTQRQWDTLNRLSAHFLDSLQGLPTLKLFNRARAHAQTIDDVSEQFRGATLRVLRVTFLSALVLELFTAISTALVAVEVSLRVLYGLMDFQPAFLILLLAPEFYLPLRMLALRFHAGMTGQTAARQICGILDYNMPAIVGAHEKESAPNESIQKVIFDAVSFTYPGEERAALRQVSFTLEAGQRLAIVGKSGAGKSTLVGLLLGFLRPDQGSIYTHYENGDVVSGPPSLSLLGWVPQNPYLFHDTIAANIRIANPSASDEEVIAATHAAHLDEFVRSLPQGYQTVIGEGGARLSAGQAQRLALARAFLKGAPILILDEATANLDPREESLVMDAVRRLTRDRMVLIVAHRLATVREADHILVLEDGRIVERGKHPELLAAGGFYARLVAAQDAIPLKEKLPLPASQFSMKQPREAPLSPETFVPRAGWYAPLARLLWFLRGSWGLIALSVLLGALTVGSNIGLMSVSAWLISAAALRPPLSELQIAVVGVRFFGLARSILRYTERLASHEVTFRLLARLRSWFYRALEPLAPARWIYYRSGDLLNRVVADVEMLENFYGRAIAPSLVALVTAIGMTFVFHQVARELAFTFLLSFIVAGLVIPWLALRLGRLPGERLSVQRAALRVALVDGVQGMADVLVFKRGISYSQNIAQLSQALTRTQRKMASSAALLDSLLLLATQGGGFAILMVATVLLGKGTISNLMLASLFLAALSSFEATIALTPAAQTLRASLQAGNRLFEIVDMSKEGINKRSEGDKTSRDLQYRIDPKFSSPPLLEISHLTFAYTPEDAPVLREVSLVLLPCSRVAIVGPSGAGKTTLLSLLLRFWQPPPGAVFINGRDVLAYDEEEVRAFFGVLPQAPFFFYATLRENLLLACPQASTADVAWALEQVQLGDFVSRLPQGLETLIGERGLRLSGGERQRLALARALLTRAPILILDEPTAHLDTLTERAVLESLQRLPRTQSLLLITHRLVGLENMDEILVLDNGRIVERGSHVALLQQGGLYAQMFALQQGILAE